MRTADPLEARMTRTASRRIQLRGLLGIERGVDDVADIIQQRKAGTTFPQLG